MGVGMRRCGNSAWPAFARVLVALLNRPRSVSGSFAICPGSVQLARRVRRVRILFAAAAVPNPTGKGYQVRLFNQIVHLERRHRVSLVTFARRDEIIEPALARACRSLRVIRRSTQAAGLGAIANVLRLPLSVALYQDAQMGAYIAETARAKEADLVVLQLVRMATYIHAAGALPVVLDLMDAAG